MQTKISESVQYYISKSVIKSDNKKKSRQCVGVLEKLNWTKCILYI